MGLPNDPGKREAFRKNISARQTGELNPNFGKSVSEETRKRISKSWGENRKQRVSKNIQRSTPKYYRIEKVLGELAKTNKPHFTAADISKRAKLTTLETARILQFTEGVTLITKPYGGHGVWAFTGETIKVGG